MVVLHYAGMPAPVLALGAAAGLPIGRVVEDAAHALGTRVGERRVATGSAAACFSFYATKNLPIGEGGMLTTDDGEIARFVRYVRLHGISHDAWDRHQPGNGWRYEVNELGIKANMTDVQAAIGRVHLRSLEAWQRRRAELARRYDAALVQIPGVKLPTRPAPGEGEPAWHLYVVQFEPEFGLSRDEVIVRFAEQGIECSVHFLPQHRQPYLQRLLGRQIVEAFPGADAASLRILSLPLYPGLTDADVDRVSDVLARLRRPRIVAAT
jgi:perosamine synthetase